MPFVIGHQRGCRFERVAGNPQIVIGNYFAAICEICLDDSESLGDGRSEWQQLDSSQKSAVSAQIHRYSP